MIMYLTTTLLSWLVYGVCATAMAQRMNREGYKINNKEKKTKLEQAVGVLKVGVILSLPIVNVLVSGCTLFFFDKLYNNIIKDWLKEGKIVKKESMQANLDERMEMGTESVDKEKDKEETKIDFDLKSREINRTRKYSQLSNNEKLDALKAEKDRLLAENKREERKKEQSSYCKEPYQKKK